eukprot:c14523_g1_i1.p1 GENE.c14523_g1_i1~~c14523_g1_i1.p1  ORF type:complete len:536 (+),score=112.75 c14523_g1_i1:560-2167(+)
MWKSFFGGFILLAAFGGNALLEPEQCDFLFDRVEGFCNETIVCVLCETCNCSTSPSPSSTESSTRTPSSSNSSTSSQSNSRTAKPTNSSTTSPSSTVTRPLPISATPTPTSPPIQTGPPPIPSPTLTRHTPPLVSSQIAIGLLVFLAILICCCGVWYAARLNRGSAPTPKKGKKSGRASKISPEDEEDSEPSRSTVHGTELGSVGTRPAASSSSATHSQPKSSGFEFNPRQSANYPKMPPPGRPVVSAPVFPVAPPTNWAAFGNEKVEADVFMNAFSGFDDFSKPPTRHQVAPDLAAIAVHQKALEVLSCTTTPEGVLYQDAAIRITFKGRFQSTKGKLAIVVENIQSAPITDVSVAVGGTGALLFQVKDTPPPRIEPGTETFHLMLLNCVQPFGDKPAYNVQYIDSTNGHHTVSLFLPITIANFLTPVDASQLSELALHHDSLQHTLEASVRVPRELIRESISRAVASANLAGLVGETGEIVQAVGVVVFETRLLVSVKFGLEIENQVNVSTRSNDGNLAVATLRVVCAKLNSA